VTVAVLLDAFVTARGDSKRAREAAASEAAMDSFAAHNTLDPLLERLSREYVDDADLGQRLQTLFKVTIR
jgi:hypothetical protein